jgi:hypothetical protein
MEKKQKEKEEFSQVRNFEFAKSNRTAKDSRSCCTQQRLEELNNNQGVQCRARHIILVDDKYFRNVIVAVLTGGIPPHVGPSCHSQ